MGDDLFHMGRGCTSREGSTAGWEPGRPTGTGSKRGGGFETVERNGCHVKHSMATR